MASKQERSDIKAERETWCAHILPAIIRDIERVIFIDETCVKTNMTPFRGGEVSRENGSRLLLLRENGKNFLLLPDYVVVN